MANSTVRVELHNADEDDYANLHVAMEEEGFVRWVVGSDGSKKHLPTALLTTGKLNAVPAAFKAGV